MLHAINHSLVKAALFLLAGNVLHLFGTKSLGKLGGLLRAAPAWGFLLTAATFAIAGSPPFGTFLSEWLLLRDTLAAGEVAAVILVMVGLTITFVAVAAHVSRVRCTRLKRQRLQIKYSSQSLTPRLNKTPGSTPGVLFLMSVKRPA